MKMVVRIASIVVILLSAGSLYYIHQIRTERNGLRVDKENLTTELNTTTNKLLATEKTLQETTATLNTTSNQLVQTITTLETTKKDLATMTEDRDKQKADLADTQQKLQTATAELATAKESLKKAEDTIASQAAEIAKIDGFKKQIASLEEENKTLGNKLETARADIKRMELEIEDLRKTPVGTRGRVAGVETRWNFLVLDIGQDQKVRKDSQFLVYRDNKYICKATIVSVGPNSAVAEIATDGRRADPRVGDIAIH